MRTVRVRLEAGPEQRDALLRTREAINRACDAVGQVAFREKCRRRTPLQRQTYRRARERFGLSAQMAVRAIALEDLGGIRERTTVRRSQRRRHLSWSFRQLRAFVEYKAAAKGVPVVLADPRNTSRMCSSCGTVDPKNRPTREEFRCGSCGLAGSADRIAATNIAARAGVDRPIVAGSDGEWGHFSDLSGKPPISIAGR